MNKQDKKIYRDLKFEIDNLLFHSEHRKLTEAEAIKLEVLQNKRRELLK